MSQRNRLREFFDSVAAKTLSAVEACPSRSNQHEFNGVTALKEMFGPAKISLKTRFIYLSDDEDRTEQACGTVTWYDARENHPTRTEYRLYFQTNEAIQNAKEGDLFIAGKKRDELYIIIAQSNSTTANQLCWLFDLKKLARFSVAKASSYEKQVDFISSRIIERLGINVAPSLSDDKYLDKLIRTFPTGFPSTKLFSEFAQKSLAANETENPDTLLLDWMTHEEKLFRTYERYFLENKIRSGFKGVDDFISFSLSIQNRRKSRAGFAFENHLEKIFSIHNLRYERSAITENRSRPDFLFPGSSEYHNQNFPDRLLAVLGVKTSCKDRWRQVLAEADRIKRKHLATLEPGISQDQTNEMKSKALTLVIPARLHSSYKSTQMQLIMSVEEFINLIKQKQQR
jgi:hypothetical protein